jgi:hypothetical protein
MTSGQPSPVPELPRLSPIQCDRCGSTANLISCRIDSVSRGLREECTYACTACDHRQTRLFERRPPPRDEASPPG